MKISDLLYTQAIATNLRKQARAVVDRVGGDHHFPPHLHPLPAEGLRLAPLGFREWAFLFAFAPLLLIMEEGRKWLLRKRA
jgi:hypothetical protein